MKNNMNTTHMKHTSQKGSAKVVAIALIVIAIVLVIIAVKHSSPAAPSQASDISTSTWKSYKNTHVGYTISFPESYHVAYGNVVLNYDENTPAASSTGAKIQIQAIGNYALPGEHPTYPVYSNHVTGPSGEYDVYAILGTDGRPYLQALVWGLGNDTQTILKILSTVKLVSITTEPHIGYISSVPAGSAIKAGSTIDVTGENFDALNAASDKDWSSKSHVFVVMTDASGATSTAAIIWEGGSKGGNVAASTGSINAKIPANAAPGGHLISVQVEGRGTSNAFPITITK